MSLYEDQYWSLVERILDHGELRPTRNQDTYCSFGHSISFDLSEGKFPLLTARKLYTKGVLGELAAFFKGPKSIHDFEKEGCNYWGQWADYEGSLQVDYGNLWLNFDGVEQLDELVTSLINEPFSRRHLVTGWHPGKAQMASLPCCHLLYQWHVSNDGHLNMLWYQRSVDVMVGLPSDAILAAAWNIHLAALTCLKPGNVQMIFGDTHIYEPHAKQAAELSDKYRRYCNEQFGLFKEPTFKYDSSDLFTGVNFFQGFNPKDLVIEGYEPMEPVKFEVFS